MNYLQTFIFAIIMLLLCACKQPSLHIVTVEDFRSFVETTDYITTAEHYDWSIVQRDITNFDVLYGINWRCPTGEYLARDEDPVTQISYHDAQAYASWARAKIPDYETYWEIVVSDTRKINKGMTTILPIDQVNIVGNVWEITKPDPYGRIRLAGGSYLCDDNTCNGTDKNRILYVDSETGNSHIGLVVYE